MKGARAGMKADAGVLIRIWVIALLAGALGYLVYGNVFDTSPEAQGARAIASACAEEQGPRRENCYSAAFREYAQEHGPVEAFRALLSLQERDSSAVGCHFIAHGIGYGTYEREPARWQDDFRTISQECTYGAMHGILELAIAAIPGGLTKEVMPEICGENPRGDCNHIVGHLALVEAQDSIAEALELCSVFKDAAQYDHCSSGIFMEEQTAFNLINHGLADESWLNWAARLPDLQHLCRKQEGRDQVMCWKELTHVFTTAVRADPEESFALCAEGPTQEAVNECMTHSVGVLGAAERFSQNSMRYICAAFGEYQDEALCHAHMISSWLSTSPRDAAQAVAYCAKLRDESARSCFAALGNLVSFNSLYLPEDAQRICAKAPREYRTLCAHGGNVLAPLDEWHPLKI